MIQVILIILVLAIANGFLNLWGVDCLGNVQKRKKYSKIWHACMAVMKAQGAFIIITVLFFPINYDLTLLKFIFWALLWFNISWTIYDFTINCIRYYYEKVASIWRVDDGAINGWIKKYLGVTGIWILRGILIIINIVILF